MIGNEWDSLLKEEKKKEYFLTLLEKLEFEYKNNTIYPPFEDIFNAFKYTSYNNIKVVIIGQDPYHNKNEAMGLCFSVNKNIKIPKSLVNIYKELNDDLDCYIPNNGDLTKWAKQGVFLLNTLLTVRENSPLSHNELNWERFTDYVISLINKREKPVVFLLWGNYAKSKKRLITNNHHLIIESSHPSPLSSYRGFFGSKPFSKTNEFLKKKNIKEIDFQIENV